MFQESHSYPTQGYTEKHLFDMSQAMLSTDAQYAAFDALFASNTDFKLFDKHLDGVPILLYQLRYQSLPEPYKLRLLYDVVKESSNDNVYLLLPRPVIDRMFSYLPNMEYGQMPFKWTRTLTDYAEYHQYLSNPKVTFAHFQIQIINNTAYVAGGNVKVARILQNVSPKKRIMFEYQPSNLYQHGIFGDYKNYRSEAKAFVLIRAVEGPNFDANLTKPDLSYMLVSDDVTYFLGFVEKQGYEKQYTEEHWRQMAVVMRSLPFLERNVGILLSARFFCRPVDLTILKGIENLKYVIVYGEEDYMPQGVQIYMLQHNIRELGRETYSHMPEKLNRMISQKPEVEFATSIKHIPDSGTNWRVAVLGWGGLIIVVCLGVWARRGRRKRR